MTMKGTVMLILIKTLVLILVDVDARIGHMKGRVGQGGGSEGKVFLLCHHVFIFYVSSLPLSFPFLLLLFLGREFSGEENWRKRAQRYFKMSL